MERIRKRFITILILLVALLILLIFVAVPLVMRSKDKGPDSTRPDRPYPSIQSTVSAESGEEFKAKPVDITVVDQLTIDEVGAYTGIFVETGDNLICKDVLALMLTNRGKQDIRNVTFELSAEGETYQFRISLLPAGGRVLAMEMEAKPYADVEFTQAQNVDITYMSKPMQTDLERFEITPGNGFFIITNHGEPVEEEIEIWYKNYRDGIFIGGAGYSTTISNGLPSEVPTKVPSVFYKAGQSELVNLWWEVPEEE